MIAYLEQVDIQLFHFLNGLRAPFWDIIMFWVSEKIFWIPFYLLLLFFIYRKFGWKMVIFILACVGLLITISDQTASGLLKPLVGRFRPCRPEAGLPFEVHIIEKCGGAYSFVSSHAANFFALATFLSGIFRQKSLSIIFFAIAGLVAYSRIYLGVHYPGDVLGGAIVGIFAGLIVISVFRWGRRRLYLPH